MFFFISFFFLYRHNSPIYSYTNNAANLLIFSILHNFSYFFLTEKAKKHVNTRKTRLFRAKKAIKSTFWRLYDANSTQRIE